MEENTLNVHKIYVKIKQNSILFNCWFSEW